jgi:hypothetical protein
VRLHVVVGHALPIGWLHGRRGNRHALSLWLLVGPVLVLGGFFTWRAQTALSAMAQSLGTGTGNLGTDG